MSKSLEEIEADLKAKPGIKKIKKDGTIDKRSFNGGVGLIGRKPMAQDEQRRTLKKIYEDFGLEEEEVQSPQLGTKEVRKEKMTKVRIVHQKLYELAKDGDVPAIREFNDRTVGKAKQPITGGDSEDEPLRIDADITHVITKIYGAIEGGD